MKFKLPEDLTALSVEALEAAAAEALAEARELAAISDDEITDEQIADLSALSEAVDAITAEVEARATADAERAAKLAAARSKIAEADAAAETPAEDEAEEEGGEDDEGDEGDEPDPAAEVEDEAPISKEKELVTASASRRGAVRRVAGRAPEADPPATPSGIGTLIAAANVPEYDSGSELGGMEALTDAFLKRSRSFMGRPAPEGEIFERFGVAQIRRPENEFTIDGRMSADDIADVIKRVTSQDRLPGNSLVAAGGWCAPSNTLYDFCEQEVVDGLLSLPEVTITHGGINFTKGPSLADVLADPNFGFTQTEAQAEAGTPKVCFEIDCPPFTDVRLEAMGWCLRAGILTASPAGWPELVRRFLNLAVIAHQYRMNSDAINRLSTAIGAATVFAPLGSATADILDALSLQARVIRETQFLPINATIEVVLPLWAPDVIRADLARRSGDMGYLTISDAQIRSLFSTRNLAVQFVRGYQSIATTGTAWPTSLEAMLYPAGSYVLGVNDVISLDTVYDSPSLMTNTYTAAFFEEARLLFNPCGSGRKVSVDISCLKGVVGASELTCVVTP